MELSYLWTRFSAFGVLIVILPQLLLAQEIECDSSLNPDQSKTLGYTIRKGDARCEGLYRSPVSSSLEIVGYRFGNSSLRSDKNVLTVSAPPLNKISVKNLNIRAEAIPLDTYYRMDTTVTEDQSFTWPLNEVVIPAGISPDELGIFGWFKKDSEKVLVPVSVYPTGSTSLAKVDEQPLTIIIRPAVNVKEILWRTYPANSIPGSNWNKLEKDNYPNRKHIKFIIPDGKTKIIGLEIVARLNNKSEWEDPQQFKIYRVGK